MIEQLNIQGLLALQLGDYDTAERLFNECIAQDQQSPQLQYNLALTYYHQGRRAEARIKFNTVVNLDRAFADAWAMLGEIYKEERRYDEASCSWGKALMHEKDPRKKNEYRTLTAFNSLVTGSITSGFIQLHGAREPAHSSVPQWDFSTPIQGKTLLVVGDQGYGDQIFYARWLPWLCSLGARLVIDVSSPLVRVFKTITTGAVFVADTEKVPDCDYHIKLSDLPLLFKAAVGTVPAQPYINIHKLLQDAKPSYVGLAWSGNPLHRNDANRSIPLKEFVPLFGLGVTFYQLQNDVRASDKEIYDNSFIERDNFYDFYEVASAIAELDLVISCDTAVANLSGAMGKETWVLVPYSADWRWMADGDKTLWYPSVKVYRQGEDRTWSPVIEQVKHDLLERLK